MIQSQDVIAGSSGAVEIHNKHPLAVRRTPPVISPSAKVVPLNTGAV